MPCSSGFGVGHTRQTQTKGIWIFKTSDDPGDDLLYVDTEGFESTGSSTAYDDRIFALATILSHTLIYNLPEAVRETDLEKLSFSSQLARAFGSDVSLHMVWLIQRDFLLGDNIESFLEPTGLSEKTDEIRDGIRVMSETNHVIGLPQPHLDRTALCDIDESEYDTRYLEARDKLRRLVREELPRLALKKDVDGTFVCLSFVCRLFVCRLFVVCRLSSVACRLSSVVCSPGFRGPVNLPSTISHPRSLTHAVPQVPPWPT